MMDGVLFCLKEITWMVLLRYSSGYVLEMRLKSEGTLVHSCPRFGAGCLKDSGRWSNVGSGQGGAADARGASLG